jgi:hypothetical protein
MTTAFDTVAGLWVKPIVPTTYVVRQEICGVVKWDTVVIYMNPVGLDEKLNAQNEELRIYPQPAKESLEVRIKNEELFKEFRSIAIYNNLGQLIRKQQVSFERSIFLLNTSDLVDGMYSFSLENKSAATLSRRFVVAR